MAGRKKKTVDFGSTKIRKPSGLKSDGTPNLHWKRFEKRLKEFDQIPIEEWKEEQVLGYLLKRYKEHYGIDFSLSYSGPPSKCSEMFCIRRMLTTIGTQKGKIAKQYIDWVFDKIIIPQKTSVKSLGFFFTAKMCNEFKSLYRKNNVITKNTQLPNDYLNIATSLDINANTYGDLAFFKLALEDNDRDDFNVYSDFFIKLREAGFDDAILNSLKE